MLNRRLISIIVPIKNEQDSIEKLASEIKGIASKMKYRYEVIFVDDGSTDNSYKIAKKISRDKKFKVIKLRGWFGKSVALYTGFNHAKGNVLITMDGDLQDDPKEIPNFLKEIDKGADVVSGWKKKRHDPLSKVIPSRVINFVLSVLTKVKIHDVNCGFKAYRKEVVDNINLYGDLYRFIPILASRKNYKISEIIINHRERKYGRSKYGFSRFISGFLDLLTVFFLVRYLKRPGHFFGTLGFLSLFFGTVIGLYITYLRIMTGGINYHYPLLFLGVLLIILGVQFIMTGLLGEMILFFQKKEDSNSYIDKNV